MELMGGTGLKAIGVADGTGLHHPAPPTSRASEDWARVPEAPDARFIRASGERTAVSL